MDKVVELDFTRTGIKMTMVTGIIMLINQSIIVKSETVVSIIMFNIVLVTKIKLLIISMGFSTQHPLLYDKKNTCP